MTEIEVRRPITLLRWVGAKNMRGFLDALRRRLILHRSAEG